MAEATTPVLEVEDNFFQGGPTGPNGFVNNSPTVTDANYSGEQPGESLDAFPNLDTDGDGLSDAAEAILGTNPSLADSDSDGIPDGVEVRLGLDPTTPNAVTDADGDGLPSNFEAVLGTSDANPDSDGDGIRDDYEVLVGTDPTVSGDTPSFGDADESGTTNNLDAIRILEAFLNISVLNITYRDRVDVNRDGNVNNVDAVILYQKTLGNIDYLPFP